MPVRPPPPAAEGNHNLLAGRNQLCELGDLPLYDGDPWEIVLKGQADKTVPLGTVLTMSATGSEMNNGSVISCHETKEKFPFNGDYPLFSILDPEALFSLPQKQIAYGLADTYVFM